MPLGWFMSIICFNLVLILIMQITTHQKLFVNFSICKDLCILIKQVCVMYALLMRANKTETSVAVTIPANHD